MYYHVSCIMGDVTLLPHVGYQCDAWFKPDPINPEKTRWEAFVDFVDPCQETRNVWDSYGSLRVLLSKQMLSDSERQIVGPLTFQYFYNFRRRYSSRRVHLYCHLYFLHATSMVKRFGSLGLYRNEAEECVNSEHKRHLDKHSAKGGWGSSMTYDVMQYSLRKLYSQFQECDWKNSDRFSIDSTHGEIRIMDWADYLVEMDGAGNTQIEGD